MTARRPQGRPGAAPAIFRACRDALPTSGESNQAVSWKATPSNQASPWKVMALNRAWGQMAAARNTVMPWKAALSTVPVCLRARAVRLAAEVICR